MTPDAFTGSAAPAVPKYRIGESHPFRGPGIKVTAGVMQGGPAMYSRLFGIHGTIGAVVEVDRPTPAAALDEIAVSANR
jgi:hypothetical protein